MREAAATGRASVRTQHKVTRIVDGNGKEIGGDKLIRLLLTLGFSKLERRP